MQTEIPDRNRATFFSMSYFGLLRIETLLYTKLRNISTQRYRAFNVT